MLWDLRHNTTKIPLTHLNWNIFENSFMTKLEDYFQRGLGSRFRLPIRHSTAWNFGCNQENYGGLSDETNKQTLLSLPNMRIAILPVAIYSSLFLSLTSGTEVSHSE